MKRRYEKPTFSKTSVRLQAITASTKTTGPVVTNGGGNNGGGG